MGRSRCSSHTLDELYAVLKSAEAALDSQNGRSRIVDEMRRRGKTRSDLILTKEKLPELIKERGSMKRKTDGARGLSLNSLRPTVDSHQCRCTTSLVGGLVGRPAMATTGATRSHNTGSDSQIIQAYATRPAQEIGEAKRVGKRIARICSRAK